MIMTLSVLALTGCSSNVAGNLSETGYNSTDMQEISRTDNDAPVTDSIPDEDSPESEESSITDSLEVPKVNNEVKAIEAYASFLKERAADEQYPFLSFTMIHLDEDDIPELAIAYGGSHADGVGFYGFDGTGVNEICVTGSLGLAYYEKGSGIAYGWYTGQGSTCYNIGIIKDGKLKEKIMPEIAIQYDENFEESGYKYYDDEGKSISKEEFEKKIVPYSPEKRQYRELNYDKLHDVHKITDIEQALRDSLAEEDNLPKPDMDYFHTNIITGE